MQWWADDTGRRRLPCSGGVMTLEEGASASPPLHFVDYEN